MTRTLLEHPSAPEFLREFQEEHLSELAFLLAQRRRYLHDPEVEWPDVESLETRIFRHVEALRTGGDIGLTCARETFASEAPDELTAGAYALVHVTSGGDGIAEVMARMAEADTVLLPCFTEALMLARHPQLSERLGTLLTALRPEVRAAAARILGHRRDGGAGPLLPLLDDSVPEVRAAAALAVADLGHRLALPVLERKLTQVSAGEVGVWALAALRLGSSRALHACRQVGHASGTLSPGLPWLLGLAGDAQDFGLLRQLCARPELMVGVLEALGILGVPAAVPLLLEHLSHEKTEVKEAAAKALALMTGAGLLEKVQVRDEDASDDEASEDAWHEVTRPSTDAVAWRAWWAEHRSLLEGKSRLRLGRPYSLDLCIEELAHSRSLFDARARAALELGIRSGQTVGFQPDWPIRRQRQAIEQWRQWWAERTRPR
ncbi:HEAT repeat domain-containing protein [Archangium sp.]|uniref:HEAT repeat domain-containing protein n=1 Tax=Archangium sp. TaxID=1872627 RepID=UPI002D63EB64|nr:HEAT repeat domain-containing protein [Archangium sp.]HYO55824.1 HEAT repeat domain-containing protein [Archangium sp.]